MSDDRRPAYRDDRNRWRSEGRRLLLVVATTTTHEAMGQRLDVSHQAMTRLLAGGMRPSLSLACAIEVAWGIAPRAWVEAPALASAIATAGCETADDGGRISKEPHAAA